MFAHNLLELCSMSLLKVDLLSKIMPEIFNFFVPGDIFEKMFSLSVLTLPFLDIPTCILLKLKDIRQRVHQDSMSLSPSAEFE